MDPPDPHHRQIVCPSPDEGQELWVIGGPLLTIGESIEYRCCVTGQPCSPEGETYVTYIPEPPGQTGLGVGLIALALLARWRSHFE